MPENSGEMLEPTRTVSRALDVLLAFSPSEPELTLTELSAKLGIHKSTLHRLLTTLEVRRFVQRDPESGKYRLGTRLVELATLVVEHNDLQTRARPYLYRLVEWYQETVDLSLLDGDEVVYLEVVESPRRVKLAVRPGQRLPAYATASGKAFLSSMPRGEVERLLPDEFGRYTDTTVESREKLFADLETARRRGFAVALQEYEEGINAVAAPVLDPEGTPVAAIALAGPAFRLPLERLLEIGTAVRAAADDLAEEVGFIRLPEAGNNHSDLQNSKH